jgi:hypothetical protein
MDEKFVVISFNEDGDPPIVKSMTGDELKAKLKENWWGERPKFVQPCKQFDAGSSGGALMIIKGEIIVPKAVQVATEYDL